MRSGAYYNIDERMVQIMEVYSSGCVRSLLESCGLNPTQIEAYFSYEACGCRKKQLQILREGRKQLLEIIHQKEEQVSCLDYLIYEKEKEIKK